MNKLVAVLATLAMASGCSGGKEGPEGPVGPPGPSGISLKWVDAAGAAASGVIAGVNAMPGDGGHTMYIDASGRFWGIDVDLGTISAAGPQTGNVFWESTNCSGQGYIVVSTYVPPRFTFTTPATTAPFNTDFFVRADTGGFTASITPQSTDGGTGCTTLASSPATPAIAITSIGPTKPTVSFAFPLHPEIGP